MILKIDRSWSIFLDRDGVINERIPDNYVRTWDEFHFIAGSQEAIKIFARCFGIIVVVTNQQGIGKGLMTVEDVELIHSKILTSVKQNGGRIDRIYFSPYLKAINHFSRKPSIGMALKAKHDFNSISFRKSVMVGDSVSDVLFGKRLGMKTVFIGNIHTARKHPHLIDYSFSDLITFANSLSDC